MHINKRDYEKLVQERDVYKFALQYAIGVIKGYGIQNHQDTYRELILRCEEQHSDIDIGLEVLETFDNDGVYPDDSYYEIAYSKIHGEPKRNLISSVFKVRKKRNVKKYYLTSIDIPNTRNTKTMYLQRVSLYELRVDPLTDETQEVRIFTEDMQGLSYIDRPIMESLNLKDASGIGLINWMELTK